MLIFYIILRNVRRDVKVSSKIDCFLPWYYQSGTHSKLKLVRFSTCNKMKSVKFRDKVMNLWEDRQFYSQILIIAQSRLEIITGMENQVSEFEISIVPRENFNPDGTMLFCLDKASLMKSIQIQPPANEELSLPGYRFQFVIIDWIVGVKCLKKKNNTKKMPQIKKQFINRVKGKAKLSNYSEI